jgi:catechol 2,3-dioxygenase-like lactoylglutathione lyase family enzyme
MRYVYLLVFALLTATSTAQPTAYDPTGQQFFALSVSDADLASAWYEKIFDLKLLKEMRTADSSAPIRIIGNNALLIEIGEMKNSQTLVDCGVDEKSAYKMQGIFKIGFYVNDIVMAEHYFKAKGVFFRHGIFDDEATHSKAFIMQDPFGNMIQVLQRH